MPAGFINHALTYPKCGHMLSLSSPALSVATSGGHKFLWEVLMHSKRPGLSIASISLPEWPPQSQGVGRTSRDTGLFLIEGFRILLCLEEACGVSRRGYDFQIQIVSWYPEDYSESRSNAQGRLTVADLKLKSRGTSLHTSLTRPALRFALLGKNNLAY